MKKLLWMGIITTLLLTGCGASESEIQTAIAETEIAEAISLEFDAQQTSDAVATKRVETEKKAETLVAEAESRPTDTIKPTNISQPTNTPSNTPSPSVTPTPTATEPPPEPIIFEGSGDSVVDIEKWEGPAIAHFVGNDAGRNFIVHNLNANNETIDLLLNKLEPYNGFVPIDFNEGENTARFEIKATGNWRIEILPPVIHFETHRIEVPGLYNGNGDDVIFVSGETPDIAKIKGNEAGRNFIIHSYSLSKGRDTLVNKLDLYEGTVVLDSDTFALVIRSVGDWVIEITAK